MRSHPAAGLTIIVCRMWKCPGFKCLLDIFPESIKEWENKS
jgi:hypothetical protein